MSRESEPENGGSLVDAWIPPALTEWSREGVAEGYDPQSVDWIQTTEDFVVYLNHLAHSVKFEPERWGTRSVGELLQGCLSWYTCHEKASGSSAPLSLKQAAEMILAATGQVERDGDAKANQSE